MRSRKARAGLKAVCVLVATLSLSSPAAPNTRCGALTSEWRHYRAVAAGFEVKFPQDWNASAEDEGASRVVVFRSPQAGAGDEWMAARVAVSSTPAHETDPRVCRRRDSHLSELYKDKVVSREEVLVDGMHAERIETEGRHGRDIFIYARFSSGDRNFCVSGAFPRSYDLARHAPVFNEMLKKFRLLPAATPHNGTHPTPHHAASQAPCVWARLRPGVGRLC